MRVLKPGIFLCYVLFLHTAAKSQVYNPGIDVQHYHFSLKINDSNDSLYGNAALTVKFRQVISSISIDLVGKNSSGTGMLVSEVQENGVNAPFSQQDDKLQIQLAFLSGTGESRIYRIKYQGIPADGLIFSKNKYGHRTVFGDNWPNRARNWLPCVDHPSDKASVDFEIIAPDHYSVISNGLQVEEKTMNDHLKLTHWKETADLPTKVMTVGIADFAVDYAGKADGIPVYSWVFPEDKDKGFYDYAQAREILPFYIRHVGPYPYGKLANVQSKTRFGGMENAGAIFYSERSVTGTRKSEALLAHEIAHQWFGDSATETNWPHLWLSEGFATYMANLYLENKYGTDTLVSRLKKDRDKVIAFGKKSNTPVVDTAEADYMQLLNANSYEKGSWVLHMLRRKVGDAVFWKGIQLYYATYSGKNASTADFEHCMESVSKTDLSEFFRQWLYTPVNPELDISWRYNQVKKSVTVTVKQLQNGIPFSFPLQLVIAGERKNMQVKDPVSEADFIVKKRPLNLIADPDTSFLFEGKIREEN